MDGYTQGDTGPNLPLTLHSTPETPLTGATATAHIRRPDGTTITKPQADLAFVPSDRLAVITWAVGDLTVPGIYEAEVEVTYSNGQIQTFPGATFMVRPQFG